MATTSLAFMLLLVPEPVWNTSIGKCVISAGSASSASQASAMAAPTAASISCRLTLARAAAALTSSSARMKRCGIGWPLKPKLFSARCVCAPHSAPAGTASSPMLSRSMREEAGSAAMMSLSAVHPATMVAPSGMGTVIASQGATEQGGDALDPWLVVVLALSLLVLAVLAATGIFAGRLVRERGVRIAELERRNDWLERRAGHAQHQGQRLFESGPVIVLALEGQAPHRLSAASPNLQRARGSPHEPPPVGQPLAELLHPDDAPALAATIEQALREPEQPVQRELRLWHAGGGARWHLLQLAADRADAADAQPVLRGYLVGIDALKQAESQAAARRRDLEELVQKMSASQRFLQTLQQVGEQLQLCDSDGEAGAIVSRAGPELFGRWAGALSFADAQGAMAVAACWSEFPEPLPEPRGRLLGAAARPAAPCQRRRRGA